MFQLEAREVTNIHSEILLFSSDFENCVEQYFDAENNCK